ncbi:MAG TPA: HlyD family efflux transporter periplasmic adaptor subunit [Candidatus Limnocylindria bacterium]|nr:HlyD family efflux transporter periplasmic adaptor subunit [Candidatus Limnocylindria bacterium]
MSKLLEFLTKQPRWRIVVVVLAIGAAAFFFSRSKSGTGAAATFTARRGPLQITVLEGGSMQAVESQEIKCEVRVGYQGTKVLKIVEEGYLVTDDDVKTNKVLVELDSSELQKNLVQQEIQFQSAGASLADAQQGYDIQLNQNLSDVMAAEQKARFARMDFEKFLGDKAAQDVIRELGLDDALTRIRVQQTATNGTNTATVPTAETSLLSTNEIQKALAEKQPVLLASLTTPPIVPSTNEPPKAIDPSAPIARSASYIDFSKYADLEVLGDGEAKQKIRKFHEDLQVAQKEMGQAQATLEGTRRLHAKQFVTRTDLQRDEIAFENQRLKVQTAETGRNLFQKYEFLKTSEETLSKYSEAVRELERARKAAVAKLAQADAKLKSATAQYNVQVRQRKDIEEQMDKCLIRSTRPGLVVYGRAGDDMIYYGGEERIREGASVRQGQTILTIPDLSKMSLRVKIHETYIKKVRKGQSVRLTADAFPDKVLDGEVIKVGTLPDSQNRWMNPDLKVYLTTISVNSTNDWLKPGMTAKAEIFIEQLTNVVYVPIQSVVLEEGKYLCYVARRGSPEKREVEVGSFNEEFIEVKKGIAEGDKVLLRPPKSLAPGGEEGEKKTSEVAPSAATATP